MRLARDRLVDRLYFRRLFHADTTLVHEVVTASLRPWETFWILFYGGCDLRQRGLSARAGVQVHVSVCAFPERDVRLRYADRHLRPAAWRAARTAQPKDRSPRSGPRRLRRLQICVQVCPVGIDIRKGLQYECIGCAACIDGCDQVMDKMGYPRGLIRYSTENALRGNTSEKTTGFGKVTARLLRPRVVIYTTILFALTALLLQASICACR